MNMFHEFERDDRFMTPVPAPRPVRPLSAVLIMVLAGPDRRGDPWIDLQLGFANRGYV